MLSAENVLRVGHLREQAADGPEASWSRSQRHADPAKLPHHL